MRMPGCTGIEAGRRIKQGPKGPIPVILMTASTESVLPAHLLSAGIDDCLIKPFEIEDLLAKVARFLEAASL